MRRLILVLMLLLWPVAVQAEELVSHTRVAILPFDTPKNQPDMEQFGVGTMDSLITGLKNVSQFIMIDRSRIEHAIKEQALATTGLVDAGSAVKVGKLLGAQVLVSGSIQVFNGQIRIVANFIDAQSGEVKDSKEVTGANIFELQDQLAGLFIKQQNVTVTAEQQQRVASVLRSTADPAAYQDYLRGRRAYLLFTAPGYEEAIRWYIKATKADPGYALAFVGLAEAWNFWGHDKQRRGELYQSDYQQAYNAAYMAVQLNPNLAEAHRALGRAFGYLGRPGRTQEAMAAQKLNPNDAETLYELWFATGNSANPDHEYIIKALELNPDLAAARLDRGLAMYQLRRYADALREFKTALQINPQLDDAHINMANSLFALKHFDEAITEFRAALRLNPNDPIGHSNLARVLYAHQQYAEAMAESKEAMRLNPMSTAARNNLGLALCALKQCEQAVNEYREALKINPNYAEAERNMGDAMYALRWYGDAINAYRAALSLNQDYLDVHFALANALFDAGRMEEAAAEFKEALRLAPDQDEAHYKLGIVWQRLGKRDQALQELHIYLQVAPNGPNAADATLQLLKLK